jgi:hypothetical protein
MWYFERMEFVVGSPLPEIRARALNTGSPAGNLIHRDEHARRYGFRAGLVPGTSIYACITRSFTEFFGREWLEHGSAEVRFVHPVYDGEELRVSGCLMHRNEAGTLHSEFQAANPQGVLCAAGMAELPCQAPVPAPELDDYPAGNRRKRAISLDLLEPGEILTPVRSEFTWNVQWEYCQKSIRDHQPIYQQLLHPGWLLSQANLILTANYDVNTWIHVASVVQKYHAQDAECVVETRGRIADKFERHGHHYAVLDLGLFAGERCLETIKHTVIFRIAPKAA